MGRSDVGEGSERLDLSRLPRYVQWLGDQEEDQAVLMAGESLARALEGCQVGHQVQARGDRIGLQPPDRVLHRSENRGIRFHGNGDNTRTPQ
jgi:hypothetical protein